MVGGSWPPWTSAESRELWNPGRSRASLFSHLSPPLLDSHHHAEQDHHRLLYEPGLEGDFPLTPHPSESAGAQRGSEWGEGVPLCSLSQKIHVSPAHSQPQALVWRKGCGGQEAPSPLCHADPWRKGRMEPGGTTAVQMRPRWPRKMEAVSTAGNQGRSLRHGDLH